MIKDIQVMIIIILKHIPFISIREVFAWNNDMRIRGIFIFYKFGGLFEPNVIIFSKDVSKLSFYIFCN